MSLKAKLEAVIYAAEEPVTLTQLATLFAGDALEWKAAQQAAAAEQTAEVANPAQSLPLIDQGLEYLGLAETPEVYASEQAEAALEAPSAAADADPAEPTAAPESEAEPQAASGLTGAEPAATEPAAEDDPADPEAEARRLARQRDRDIKGVLKHLLDELIADYVSDARGVEIREIAGGYRMATKPECHDAVRLFVKSLKPPMKLSLPALETLAVVAYKQPVTSPEVSEIRGVESGGVLGSLLARKLIATAGRKQVIGRPILYKTTKEFLLRFGLKDLTELPSMEEFEKMAAAEIEEMEPEAVAADAADAAAELEENSPSGEELAGTGEIAEGELAIHTEEGTPETQLQSQPVPGAVSPAPKSEHIQPAEPADLESTQPEPPNPESNLESNRESEAVPHAEEIKEKH